MVPMCDKEGWVECERRGEGVISGLVEEEAYGRSPAGPKDRRACAFGAGGPAPRDGLRPIYPTQPSPVSTSPQHLMQAPSQSSTEYSTFFACRIWSYMKCQI